ncbi:hypothetical protein XA68_15741 [Ophiocordyceps unilateralis]|uniref:Actin-related protein 2/3 complex subunit 3 n=1 Tax=Ophiocordyceps unilateralis TaxID=268505 RepID=A0A2A9P7H0_OPHUN|nr:hypothetical protein XA68_15741 [Ophiocordyceps unilateralis]
MVNFLGRATPSDPPTAPPSGAAVVIVVSFAQPVEPFARPLSPPSHEDAAIFPPIFHSFELTSSPLPSQAYNSVFNDDPNPPRLIGNFPLLPLRTKTRGPAYTLPIPAPPLPPAESPDPDNESYDILDETLSLFRANTFFRNFEIQGPADRLLVYGIWFLSDCLQKIKPNASARDAQKDVMNLALDLHFAIPGDPGFPLNQMYEPPRDRQDAEQLKLYMSQVRQELAIRLLARIYADDETKPSKWWLSFTKRKFMGKAL